MALIKIRLSKKQMEILKPLFEEAEASVDSGKGMGAIFLQPRPEGKTGYAEGKFLPPECAKQVNELIVQHTGVE